MKKISENLQNRASAISIAVILASSFICTRIPLLNYLGFEFSFATVLIAGFVSGLLTLSIWKTYEKKEDPGIWTFIREISGIQFVLFAVPFLISLVNAVFIKNCSIGGGALLYVLTVLPGIFFSMSIAVFIGAVFKKWRKTTFIILYIFVLLHIPFVTFLYPQIFAFNPVAGFFPGFSYDETLQIIPRLLVYRLAVVAFSVFILATISGIGKLQMKKFSDIKRARGQNVLAEILMFATLGPVFIVIFLLSDRIGLSSSEDFIKLKLAGNYRTEHCDIIYPAGSIKRDEIEQIGRLHEFYFERITKDLNVKFQDRITCFIYSSPEQKGKLMGAAGTDIAKPWLNQIHINMNDVEYSLKHEMVHVIAGGFGLPILKVAPNSGLVEGLAVAMGQTAVEEPLHRAAALAMAAKADPGLESVFSNTGFFKSYAGVSYTLAGSFCKFLIDTLGIEKFKSVYGNKGIKEAYGEELKELLMKWQSYIGKVHLTSADSIKAIFYFRRQTIFGKECVRVIANMNSETGILMAKHEYEEALRSAERSISVLRTREAVSQKAISLFELRRFDDVIDFINGQMSDTLINYSLLPLHARLGDSYWAKDSLVQAVREYKILQPLHLGSWYEEALALRLASLNNIGERSKLRAYFVYSMEDTARISQLEKMNSSAARYLLAREYSAKGRVAECIRILESLEPFGSEALEYFRLKRLGKSWFEMQEYGKAKKIFERSLSSAPSDFYYMQSTEWIERCDFNASYKN